MDPKKRQKGRKKSKSELRRKFQRENPDLSLFMDERIKELQEQQEKRRF